MDDECFKEIEEIKSDSTRNSAKLGDRNAIDMKNSPDLQTFIHLLNLLKSTNEEEIIHSLSKIYRFVRHKNYIIFTETNAADSFIEAINMFISNRTYPNQKNVYELPSIIFKIFYKMAEDSNFDDFFTPDLFVCLIDSYQHFYNFQFFMHCSNILIMIINYLSRKIIFEPILQFISSDFIDYLLNQLHELIPISENKDDISRNSSKDEEIYDYKNDIQGHLRNTIILFFNKLLCVSFQGYTFNYDPVQIFHKLIELVHICFECKNRGTNLTVSIFLDSIIIKETPEEVLNIIDEQFHENIVNLLVTENNNKCKDNIFGYFIHLAQYHENIMKNYIHILNIKIDIQPISSFSFLLAVLCNCNDISILQSIPSSLWLNLLLDSSEEIPFNDKEMVVRSLTGLITTKQEILVAPFITENCYIIWFIVDSLDCLSIQNIKNCLISLIIIRSYMEKTECPYIEVFSNPDFIDKIKEIEEGYEDNDDIVRLSNELIPEQIDDEISAS